MLKNYQCTNLVFVVDRHLVNRITSKFDESKDRFINIAQVTSLSYKIPKLVLRFVHQLGLEKASSQEKYTEKIYQTGF